MILPTQKVRAMRQLTSQYARLRIMVAPSITPTRETSPPPPLPHPHTHALSPIDGSWFSTRSFIMLCCAVCCVFVLCSVYYVCVCVCVYVCVSARARACVCVCVCVCARVCVHPTRSHVTLCTTATTRMLRFQHLWLQFDDTSVDVVWRVLRDSGSDQLFWIQRCTHGVYCVLHWPQQQYRLSHGGDWDGAAALGVADPSSSVRNHAQTAYKQTTTQTIITFASKRNFADLLCSFSHAFILYRSLRTQHRSKASKPGIRQRQTTRVYFFFSSLFAGITGVATCPSCSHAGRSREARLPCCW
jgi:hypothetical protein